MRNRRKVTPTFLVMMCILYALIIVSQCVQVIYTPHTFVKVINLLTIILLSSIIGAFIRELFVLKKK
ncbi:hypothetical protein [Psychrobacillus sp.]|uniref:hypothetical protein n=1 Tax=Psychrobacillus sp. TaxID=1871623 RepID=UPI0028BD9F01|nr:hypothetical protein [Psychrobacillus sp.]